MRSFIWMLAVVASLLGATAALSAPTDLTPEQRARVEEIRSIVDNLHPRSGFVSVPAAKATLALGDDFYFLGADEAKAVLTKVWGNPPEAVQNVLGMVFPQGASPVDDTWGAVLTYLGDGYVSDSDAHRIDATKLLDSMREGEDDLNKQRQQEGFPASHLVGWAEPPTYNAENHNLIWAKIIAFSGEPEHTLNYDVRVLGRAGVLSMNIIAGADDLAEIRPEASRLMARATFDAGARYADYVEGADKKANYGVMGLIAGGAALAVAKKVGLLGLIVVFAKKGFVIILAALAGAWSWFRKRVSGQARARPDTLPEVATLNAPAEPSDEGPDARP